MSQPIRDAEYGTLPSSDTPNHLEQVLCSPNDGFSYVVIGLSAQYML